MAGFLNVYMCPRKAIKIEGFFGVFTEFVSGNEPFPERLTKATFEFWILCIEFEQMG